MTVQYSSDNFLVGVFVGIDVSAASFDVAWHRGDHAVYANHPDKIALFVERLRAGPPIARLAVEWTGGYEKRLVKALRRAGFNVEMVHGSRFFAYRQMVGANAKSDPSDAKLLAAYAAAPDDVRGRKPHHVELPEDGEREELAELASRRGQLKGMIHAETCRLAIARNALVREVTARGLAALKHDDREVAAAMTTLVRQRDDLATASRLLRSITGIGEKTAIMCLAIAPELGHISGKSAAALIGVAPFVRRSGGRVFPAHIFGGRKPLRDAFYMAAVTASRHNRVLKPFYERLIASGKPVKVALVAIMRRLVVFANAVLRSGQPWRGNIDNLTENRSI